MFVPSNAVTPVGREIFRVLLSFDDVVVLPSPSPFEPERVSTKTKFSSNVTLSVPFAASPMDTVVDSEVAKLVACMGGIGVIHRAMSAERQLREVLEVQSAAPEDVPHVDPEMTLTEAYEKLVEHGKDALPVLREGVVLGIVLVMPKLVGAAKVTSRSIYEVFDELRREKKSSAIFELDNHLLIVELYHSHVTPTCENGSLTCAAAVSPFDHGRIQMLDGKAPVLVCDLAHFCSEEAVRAIRALGALSSDLVVGNVATYEEMEYVITHLEELSGVRVGMGSGSICSTSIVTGVGVPTLQAVIDVARALRDYGVNVPVIADGGIRTPGDALKALAAGAHCVMCGRMLAGCIETPAPVIEREGKLYKLYRGMGSLTARLSGVTDRYNYVTKLVAEGVEALVPLRGSVFRVMHEFIKGLRLGMWYAGARDIDELHRKCRLACLTPRGASELSPHDVVIIPPERVAKALSGA